METEDTEAGYSILEEDDPHYAAVGFVASLWGILENLIDGVIADLANCGELEMACVTAQLIGPARRMDALIALFRHREGSEQLKIKLKKFQGQIQQLGEDRNRIVHDPLFKGKKTGKIYKSLAIAKGDLQYSFILVDLKAMKKTAGEIRTANYSFMELKAEIDSEMRDILAARLKRIGVALPDQNPPGETA